MVLTEPYLDFLIKNDITQEQFLLLKLLHEERIDLIQKYKKTFPIPNEQGMISKAMVERLVVQKFLIKITQGQKITYKVGQRFKDAFVTPYKAVDEIYDLYPVFMLSEGGTQIPLTAMDRMVFEKIYIPKIMGSLVEHKEVLRDIQYGIDNGLIKMGINKFLTSEQWKGLRKLRKTQNPTNTTTTLELDKDF